MSYHDSQTLAQYHLHSEVKFANGDAFDSGFTERRHIVVDHIEHIGKEADRLDEQMHLGVNLEAQLEYGPAPSARVDSVDSLKTRCISFPIRALAREAGLGQATISRIAQGKQRPRREQITRLEKALGSLERKAAT
jgi:hypothetical protein